MNDQRHDPPQYRPLFGEPKELADQDRDSTPATINRRRIKGKTSSSRTKQGAVALRGVGAAEIVNRGWSDRHDQLIEGSRDP
jgi:hypothetical protein